MPKRSGLNILILSCLNESTGNATTAHRISSGLNNSHNVILIDVLKTDLKTLKKIIIDEKIDAAIGLHALHSGPYLHALNIPYALIMGGTDMYHHLEHEKVEKMSKALQNAGTVIAFSEENLLKTDVLCPGTSTKGVCIHQAVSVEDIDRSFQIRDQLGLSKSTKLAILPAGIRPVKDPFFLIQACHKLHLSDNDFHLYIAGPILDPEFAQEPLEQIKSLSGVHYINGLPRPQMLAAIEQADVVLNTSISEGMSSAILESMALHTPVIARANEGNISIIQHNQTGFIFTEVDEAISLIKMVFESAKLIAEIDANCQKFLSKHHSVLEESRLYSEVLDGLVKNK